jgi:phospholipid/cholesterol/gamma-HCH transport system substrate-binding protein
MLVTKTVEFAVGVFVALGLAAFFMLAMKVSDVSSLGDDAGYVISARFDNIGGLKVRSPVTLAGVRIGRVTSIDIDLATYEAVVSMSILSRYDQLPEDSSASILTSGILGEQYIGIEPGGVEDYLADGGSIQLTQSALVLEQLIGRFLTGAASGDGQQ